MNKAQSQAQARTTPNKPPKAVAKASGKAAASSKATVRSGDVHHGKIEVATQPGHKKAQGRAEKAEAAQPKVAAAAGAAKASKKPATKAVARAKVHAAKANKPVLQAGTPSKAAPPATHAGAASKVKSPTMSTSKAEANGAKAASNIMPVAMRRMEPVAIKQAPKMAPVGHNDDDDRSVDPLEAMAKVSRAAAQAASNEDKLALALATRPVHEAVEILAEAGVGSAPGSAADGQSRTFRDDPSLDRRIIEGMLDDKDSFLDNMHRQGFGRDAVVRRAAELGLSEALIRQVKGVAADLAGERPGRRPTPSSLGARTCLSCDRVFFSSGPGNRLCTRCRGGDAGLAQL